MKLGSDIYNNSERKLRLSLLGLVILCLGLFPAACIEVLDQDLEVGEGIAINGQFSNSEALSMLTVRKIGDFAGRGGYIEASGKIYKDGQPYVDLVKKSTGILIAPPQYKIEDSAAYFVEVELVGGEIYRSEEQVVRPRIKTDSISLRVIEDYTANETDLQPFIRTGIEFYAHVDLPEFTTEPRFYRWVVDESWKFVGLGTGPVNQNICYVQKDIYKNGIALVSNAQSGFGGKSVEIPVLKRGLDYSFEHQHYVNVYLHNLDSKTFDFHQKVQKVINSSGTIYDEVPGPVKSNLYNLENPDARTIGWVEFFLADTLRIRVRPSSIPHEVPPQCDFPPGIPPNNRCLNCGNVFGQESLVPPSYWEE